MTDCPLNFVLGFVDCVAEDRDPTSLELGLAIRLLDGSFR